ncbi:MAG: hypothetical protein ACXADO_00190 [Candidatus Thorarchaeota archaeon]
MADEKDDRWFIKALQDKAIESEREQYVIQFADAIGERRSRDLLDIVATVESSEGWSVVIQYLIMTADAEYVTPASFGKVRTHIEPIKYREMVFDLLSASGLEPVESDTVSLLRKLENEESLVTASQSFGTHVQELGLSQISEGDTLFFDFPAFPTQTSKELVAKIESARLKEISELRLRKHGNRIDVTSLWHSEYGRRALSELGVQTSVTEDQLSMVLSVIQVSPTVKRGIKILVDESPSPRECPTPPNPLYASLLKSMIKQDLESLCSLASRHSLPTLSTVLENSVGQYQESLSSEDYRHMLECMNTHVAVRTLDSIMAFQKLVKLDNPRIVTPAINALGNFYNESSVLTLAETLCQRKDEWVVTPVLDALDNVYRKCPEAEPAIKRTLESECANSTPLKRFLRRVAK